MKRRLIDYQCASTVNLSTRSKKPCLIRPITQFNNYVSASSVINYLQNDCLIDWLKIRKEVDFREKRYKEENYLCEQGNKFEKAVVDYINENIVKVEKVSDPIDFSENGVKKTLELMKMSTPIIYSAPIRSKQLKLFGTADLLVRNDYIPKLFKDLEEEKEEIKSDLPHSFYYAVVDIKWCTLALKSDGKQLLNVDRTPGYKGQLTIYNHCLAEMQGFKPSKAYLLGRKYRYISMGKTFVNRSPFEKPGVFFTTDQEFENRVHKAVQWVRDLERTGNVLKISPPTIPELYPNLGGKYYYSLKKELAIQIGDLSLLYGVKSKAKTIAFSKGIYNLNDGRLSGSVFNFKGKTEKIVDKIIWINRRETTDIIYPKKLENNLYGWKEDENEIFVDFEKFTDIIDDFENISDHRTFDMVFLIGVGWFEKGLWNYKKFLATTPDKEGELKIINEFISFVRGRNNPKIWYYYAEDKFWKSIIKKYSGNENLGLNMNWCDLRKVLIEDPFVIKGCYDFKLKSVLEGLNNHSLISHKNKSECKDGFTAMLDAYKYYQNNDTNVMKQIIEYNKYDVKGLFEVLNFLRKNGI